MKLAQPGGIIATLSDKYDEHYIDSIKAYFAIPIYQHP